MLQGSSCDYGYSGNPAYEKESKPEPVILHCEACGDKCEELYLGVNYKLCFYCYEYEINNPE
jgi:hypothetical protein